MRVEVVNYVNQWDNIKLLTLGTIGLTKVKNEADSEWKSKMLRCKHSPIRAGFMIIRLHDLPYWISVHLCRHKIGVEHFCKTQRDDRNNSDISRNDKPQGETILHTMLINFEAIMNISKKRLCGCASRETQEVWIAVLNAIREHEPELVELCMPECVEGKCNEFVCCGKKALYFDL